MDADVSSIHEYSRLSKQASPSFAHNTLEEKLSHVETLGLTSQTRTLPLPLISPSGHRQVT